MQTQAPTTGRPPGAPAQAVIPGPNGANATVPVPMTRSEVRALQSRRGELSTQLNSAQSRRGALARQLQDPAVVDRAGLEAQVKFLDGRILGIESDIAENGKALASIPANLRQSAAPPAIFQQIDPGVVRDLTGLLVVAMLVPFAWLWARRMWRNDHRRIVAGIGPDRWEDGLARMERLETAVEAVALEVSRVAEGQRFITTVLAEPAAGGAAPPKALGAGDAPFVPLASRQRVGAARAGDEDDGGTTGR